MSALQNSRIVPDIFDAIDDSETVEFAIKYPKHKISNGNSIPKEDAQDAPTIDIKGEGMYTLIVSDPDAPSPDKPTLREFLHMLVTNIPQGDLSRGQVVVPYMGPAPPEGAHRYVFTLWRQAPEGDPNQIAKDDWDHPVEAQAPGDRKSFSTRKFAAEHRLRGPVRCDFFYSSP